MSTSEPKMSEVDVLVNRHRIEYENGEGILGHQYSDLSDLARRLERERNMATDHISEQSKAIAELATRNEELRTILDERRATPI